MGFAFGGLEVVGIDHRPIGEAKAIAIPLPGLAQRMHVMPQKLRHHHQITIDKNDYLTFGVINAKVAADGGAAMFLADQADMGQCCCLALDPLDRAVGGAVIHQDHLKRIAGIQGLLGF